MLLSWSQFLAPSSYRHWIREVGAFAEEEKDSSGDQVALQSSIVLVDASGA